jgi:hypothetical protein
MAHEALDLLGRPALPTEYLLPKHVQLSLTPVKAEITRVMLRPVVTPYSTAVEEVR